MEKESSHQEESAVVNKINLIGFQNRVAKIDYDEIDWTDANLGYIK